MKPLFSSEDEAKAASTTPVTPAAGLPPLLDPAGTLKAAAAAGRREHPTPSVYRAGFDQLARQARSAADGARA